jgi:hypothetical protein
MRLCVSSLVLIFPSQIVIEPSKGFFNTLHASSIFRVHVGQVGWQVVQALHIYTHNTLTLVENSPASYGRYAKTDIIIIRKCSYRKLSPSYLYTSVHLIHPHENGAGTQSRDTIG